jgi:hypothetical protein
VGLVVKLEENDLEVVTEATMLRVSDADATTVLLGEIDATKLRVTDTLPVGRTDAVKLLVMLPLAVLLAVALAVTEGVDVAVDEGDAHPACSTCAIPPEVHSPLCHMNSRMVISTFAAMLPKSRDTSYPLVRVNTTSSAPLATPCCVRRKTPTVEGGEAGSAYCTSTSTVQLGLRSPKNEVDRLPEDPEDL